MNHQFNYKATVAGLALTFGAMLNASADTLLADNFQGSLGQWAPIGSAVVVADPLVAGGSALAFNAPTGGGDIFSAASYASSTGGNFILSYDYLGIGAGGGYVGFNNGAGETWLTGDGSYPYSVNNPDTGSWQHVSVSFNSASAITLKLEEWNGQNGVPQQAFFKNLVLTDANGVTPVPEPESYAMLLAGLGLLGAMARRKKVSK